MWIPYTDAKNICPLHLFSVGFTYLHFFDYLLLSKICQV